MISNRKYLKQNTVSTICRVGVSSISTLILTPFIIQGIGLSMYGYISITAFFVSYSGLFDIGISKAIVFLVNEKGISEQEQFKYISGVYAINLAIIALLAVAGAIAIALGLEILGPSIPNTDERYLLISISSVATLCLSIFNMLQASVLESYFKLDQVNYGVMLKIMILNLIYFVNLLIWNSITLYILAAVVSCVCCTVYYDYLITTQIRFRFVKTTMSNVKRIATTALKFAGVGVFSSINSSLPRIAIVYLSNGLANIAILDVITKLSSSIINLGGSIARPFFALTRVNEDKIRRAFGKICGVYFAGGVLFVISVFIFRNYITEYFFHNDARQSLLNFLLMIYVIASVLFLIGQPMSMYLMGVGRVMAVVKTIMSNTVLFFVSFLILNHICNQDVLISLSIANILMALQYVISLFVKARAK